jgi:hypothetical protein
MKKFSKTLCYTCGETITFSEHVVSPTTGRMIPLDVIDLRQHHCIQSNKPQNVDGISSNVNNVIYNTSSPHQIINSI